MATSWSHGLTRPTRSFACSVVHVGRPYLVSFPGSPGNETTPHLRVVCVHSDNKSDATHTHTHTHTHTRTHYRAMEFIHTFIGEVANGEQSLDVAAGKILLRPHQTSLSKGGGKLVCFLM